MLREDALKLMRQEIENNNLKKHMFAAEACMRSLGRRFNENEELWAQAGMLHDLDYVRTKDNFSQHGLVTAEILAQYNVAQEVIEAIKAHPGHCPRQSLMAKALYAVDPLTGLIVASALMHPQKKLSGLDAQFILNRFKEKHFARGANRKQISACLELGISLEDFVSTCLSAMQQIHSELGL